MGDVSKAAEALKQLDIEDKFTKLKNAFPDVADDAIRAALGITETGEAAVTASSKLANLGKAGKGAGAVLTNTFSKLGALVVAHPIIATLAGIAVAFTAVSAVVTDAQEKVEEAISSYGKYETAQSEAESLRSELETIGTQIDELNAKENLSFTDQQELANLQAQSAELERQLEIKDAIAKREQENAARDASEAFSGLSARNAVDMNKTGFWTNIADGLEYASAWVNDKFGLTELNGEGKNSGGIIGLFRGSKTETTDKIFLDRIQLAIKAQEELNKIQNEAPELTGNYDYDTIALNQWTRKVEEQQQVVNNYADDLQNLYSEMESITPAFYNADGSIVAGYEDEVARWEKVQSEYLAFLGKPVSSVESTIDGILSKVEYSEFEDILVKVGQNGSKALERALSSGNYDGLIDSLAETLDISTDEAQSHLQDYIMAIADPDALKMDVVKDQLAEAFTPDDVDAETAKQQWQDFTKDLSDEDLTILYSIKQSKDTSTWTLEDWKHNFDEARDSAIDLSEAIEKVNSRISVLNQLGTEGISSDKLLDAISQADETENAGDDYLKADSYLDEAKKMYDKGLIGTDDFKARAAYFSPTMATDPANFIENYKKAKNYLTENATGLLNFLNDLEDKGLASSKVLKDGTKQWTYDIKDFESAAQKMGISTEFMLDIFGRLEDYGFSNNFASNVEEANEKIVDKAAELANAKAKLAEMETTGQYTTLDENGNEVKTLANSTALQEQRELVQLLEQDLLQLQNTREYLASREADTYAEQVKQAKEAYDTLKKERDEILQSNKYGDDTSSVVALLDENLAQLAEEYHLEVEPEIDIDTLSLSELESELAIATAQLAVFKDPITGEIDLSIDGAQEAVDTVDTIIRKKMELSQPAVMHVDSSQLSGTQQQVIQAIQAYESAIEEIKIAMDKMNTGIEIENISELNANFFSAKEELKNLLVMNPEAQKVAVELGFNIDANSAISEINEAIDEATFSTIAEGIKATLTWENNTDEVDAFIKDAHIATGTVNWTNNTALVKTKFSATGTITWTNPYEKFVNGKGSIATGTLLSPAKASGTAYNMLNLKPAYAGGKVALEHDQTALVNELPGHEGIIRNGQLYKIPGGMHYQNLKQGDIVLSASQMEQLERTGRASGKGQPIGWARSFAQGTLIQPAYASGSGGGSFGAGGSGSKSGVTASGTKATSNNTKAIINNAKATNTNTETLDDIRDWAEIKLDRISHQLDEYISLANDYYSAHKNQNKMLDLALSQIQKNVQTNKDAYSYYMALADKVSLSANYKNKVKDGTISIETITDENLKKQIEQFQEYYEKAVACRDTIIELNAQIKELAAQKAENIIDDYDTFLGVADSIYQGFDSLNNLANARGESTPVSNLETMLNQRNIAVTYTRGELEELTALEKQLVADGVITKWSQEWYALQGQIQDVYTQLYDFQTDIYELQQQIREVRWEPFTKGMEEINAINDNLESTLSLISDLETFGKDSDVLNINGKVQLGLLASQLGNARKAVAEYENAFVALNKELANGNITQAQYKAELQELTDGRNDAIASVKEYRDSILSLVKEGIEKETDAMRKLIDARKEDLQAQKESADYARSLAEKTSAVNKIKAQIAALEGDDSASARAQKRNLQNQLREAQEELDIFQEDHMYDELEKGLDDAMEKFEETQESELYLLNSSLEAQNEAIANMLMVARDNYQDIYNELNEIAEVYGYKLSEDLVSPWTSAKSAIAEYKQAITDLQASININIEKLPSVSPGTDYVHYAESSPGNVDSGVQQEYQQAASQAQQQSSSTSSSMLGYVSGIAQTLQYGSRGDNVRKLQNVLNALGYNAGNVDGIFGSRTQAAVIRFQRAMGISSDGVVGKNTKAKFRQKGYASGTTNATSGWHLTDENGEELIFDTKQGKFRMFAGGEMVFTHEQAKALWEQSKFGLSPTIEIAGINEHLFNSIIPRHTGVTNNFESFITVQGNVTEDVMPKLERMIDSKIQRFDEITRRNIDNDYRKRGFRR